MGKSLQAVYVDSGSVEVPIGVGMLKLSEIDVRKLEHELYTCAQCGYCVDACPIYEEIPWESATPRGKLYWIKQILTTGILRENIKGDQNFVERIYQCTLCGRCHEVCQTSLDTVSIWNAARAEIFKNGQRPENLEALAEKIEEVKNPYGIDEDTRLDWADYTDYDDPPEKEQAEVCYFVGCTTAFKSANHETAHSISVILDHLEEDWTLLGEDEWCCGAPLQMSGDDEAVKRVALHNLKELTGRGIKLLITGCPSCYRMWKTEIPHLLNMELPFQVKHFTEYLSEKIENGALILPKGDDNVTYHDPCELARLCDIVEEPRVILKAATTRFQETREHGKDVRCCGGGGMLEATNNDLRVSICKYRLSQVEETGASILTSSCPSCNNTFIDAQRESDSDVEVLDIAVYVAQKLGLI